MWRFKGAEQAYQARAPPLPDETPEGVFVTGSSPLEVNCCVLLLLRGGNPTAKRNVFLRKQVERSTIVDGAAEADTTAIQQRRVLPTTPCGKGHAVVWVWSSSLGWFHFWGYSSELTLRNTHFL
jgi:hypothetical protein